jgi:hypothetical protein
MVPTSAKSHAAARLIARCVSQLLAHAALGRDWRRLCLDHTASLGRFLALVLISILGLLLAFALVVARRLVFPGIARALLFAVGLLHAVHLALRRLLRRTGCPRSWGIRRHAQSRSASRYKRPRCKKNECQGFPHVFSSQD